MNKIIFIALLIAAPFAWSVVKSKPVPKEGVSEGIKNNDSVYQAIVDQQGNGDYLTIQEAIDHAPEGQNKPWKIFINNGTYEELVRVPAGKRFIHLIGNDPYRVIITFKINCGNPKNEKEMGIAYSKVNFDQKDCATVVVEATDFYAENISFENSWGVEAQSGPQALAFKGTNDRMAFYNCRFRSFQDTWMTSIVGVQDRTYASNCWIEGAVDYFYGAGNAYIELCTFYNVRSGSVIVAPSHKQDTKYGYVFNHCVVDGNEKAADGTGKLGRPWHHRPIAVFLNTTFNIPMDPQGWTDMGPAARLFAEYNSRNADGELVDLSNRRTWYQQRVSEGGQKVEGLTAVLSQEHAEKYSYDSVIYASDQWNPRAFFKNLGQLAGLKLSGNRLTWRVIPGAVGYAVYQRDKVLAFTQEPVAILADSSSRRQNEIKVYAINPSGSISGLYPPLFTSK